MIWNDRKRKEWDMKIDRRKYRKRREKGDSIGYYERKGKVWDIREKGESMGYEEGKGRV